MAKTFSNNYFAVFSFLERTNMRYAGPAYPSMNSSNARAVSWMSFPSGSIPRWVKASPMKAPLSVEEAQRGVGAAANLGAKLLRRDTYALRDGSAREILTFEKNSPTPTKYPRPAALISKKPL